MAHQEAENRPPGITRGGRSADPRCGNLETPREDQIVTRIRRSLQSPFFGVPPRAQRCAPGHQLCFRPGPGTEYVALTSTNAPAGASPPSFGSPRGRDVMCRAIVEACPSASCDPAPRTTERSPRGPPRGLSVPPRLLVVPTTRSLGSEDYGPVLTDRQSPTQARTRTRPPVVAEVLADGTIPMKETGRRADRDDSFALGQVSDEGWILWWQRRRLEDR